MYAANFAAPSLVGTGAAGARCPPLAHSLPMQSATDAAAILDDDEDARMGIRHKFTQDFDSSGTECASLDTPIADTNIG